MSNEMQPAGGERGAEAGKRSLVQGALDAIFGYDFFISLHETGWRGKEYAEAFAHWNNVGRTVHASTKS
jgi:hypothetical protein